MECKERLIFPLEILNKVLGFLFFSSFPCYFLGNQTWGCEKKSFTMFANFMGFEDANMKMKNLKEE